MNYLESTVLLAQQEYFWIALRHANERLWYNQDYPEETLSYNICDGFFFPAMKLND